jgi:hypothetical protein
MKGGAKMTKLTLSLVKTTPQKVVFGEIVEENSFEVATIPSLYLDKRDIQKLGLSKETPRLEVTIKAVPAS